AMVATVRSITVLEKEAAVAEEEPFFPVRRLRRPMPITVLLAALAVADVVRGMRRMAALRSVQAAAVVVLVVLPANSVSWWAPAITAVAMVASVAAVVVAQVMAEMAGSAVVAAPRGIVVFPLFKGLLEGAEALERAVALV